MSVFTKEELTEANQGASTISISFIYPDFSTAFEDHLKKLGGFFLLFPFGLTGHDITQAPHWVHIPPTRICTAADLALATSPGPD